MVNISYNQLRKAFRNKLGLNTWRAVIGATDGSLDVPTRPGWVYVSYVTSGGNLSAKVAVKFTAVCAKTIGSPVIIGYDEAGDLAILKADFDGQVATNINPLSSNPADENVPTIGDVNQYQITTLKSSVISTTTPSMLVTVQPWFYVLDSTAHFFLGGDGDGSTPIDLTAYIPVDADTQCLACLFLNTADDTVEIQVSSNVPLSDPLDMTNIQEALDLTDNACYFIHAWRLYDGQIGISPDPVPQGDNFLDGRGFINVCNSGGGSALSVTDGTTTVDPTTTIHFDPTYFDVTDAGGAEADVTFVGTGFAPSNAHYVTTQAESGLSNEFNLGGLSSGLLKQSVTTGVATPAIATAGTDYTTPTGTEGLSNKTITASSLIATALSVLIGGFKGIFTHANTADRTYTFQDSSDTIIGRATTDTLTNKTLTSPTINTPVISGGTIDNTPIGTTTRALGYFSALREYIGGFAAIFTHANSADRTYTFKDANGTVAFTADIPSLPLSLANGGTHADLSATGGTGQLLKQSSTGADVTVGQITDTSLSAPVTSAKLADYWRQPARVLSVANVSVSSAPASIDSVTLASGDRILLIGQSTGSQNGLWVFNGTGSALTRPVDYAAASTTLAIFKMSVLITEGTAFTGSAYYISTTGTITIDTTTTAWVALPFNVGQLFGTLSALKGGTGNSGYNPKGDLLVSTGTASLGRLAAGADNLPVIADSSQATGLKYAALPIAGGGTGQTTQAAGFNALSPATTKGDLIVYSSTGVRQAVGADYTHLVADSAQTNGIKYSAWSIAIVENQQTQNTAGGATTATTWTTCTLNQELSDVDGIVTIATNQFTPIAGAYRLHCELPFLSDGTNNTVMRLRIRNVTQSNTVLVIGSNFYASNVLVGSTAMVDWVITANGTDAYDYQYFVTRGRATNGLGLAINEASAVEHYGRVVLEKLA